MIHDTYQADIGLRVRDDNINVTTSDVDDHVPHAMERINHPYMALGR
jgi:hypothetical protein